MLLDPLWETPRNKRDELLQYLKDVQNSVNNSGRVKPKRLYQMIRVFKFFLDNIFFSIYKNVISR